METYNKVISDFNNIALLNGSKDNNSVYHKLILENIDHPVDTAFDIGCGKGVFTRLLAARAGKVTGIDISPEMILKANELSADFRNINYATGNVLDLELGENSFDIIVSIAAFHHIDMELLLPKLKLAVKKNGKLIVLDLYKPKSFYDHILSFISLFYSRWIRLWNKRSYAENNHTSKIWKNHASTDIYMSFQELKELYNKFFNNCYIKRKLLWRYIMIWEKH